MPRPGTEEAAPSAPQGRTSRRKLETRHYVYSAIAAVVLALLVRWLGPILTPFLVGAIIAYLGNPLVDVLARRGLPRTVGALLVILLAFLALLLLGLLLAPLVHAEMGLIVKRAPELFSQFSARILAWLESQFGIVVSLDVAGVREWLGEHAQDAQDLSLRIFSGLRAGGTLVLALFINLALVPVVMFYLLRDWKMILHKLTELIPRRWVGTANTVALEIDTVLAEFLRGQLLVMVVLALYYSIALSIAGLRFALPIGILTGLLVFIPYVGFGLGLTLGMLAALLQWNGWPEFFAILAVYGLGQLLENYVLVPWLVGDRIGLHPLAVIFALLAFGQLFGFAGVLLALPVSAMLLVGLRHLRGAYQRSPLYH